MVSHSWSDKILDLPGFFDNATIIWKRDMDCLPRSNWNVKWPSKYLIQKVNKVHCDCISKWLIYAEKTTVEQYVYVLYDRFYKYINKYFACLRIDWEIKLESEIAWT